MTRSRGTALWVALNAGGAMLYLYSASWVWPEQELRGTSDAIGPGDPFVWGLSALPILVLCAVLNLTVLAWLGVRPRHAARWQPRRWSWVIPALWATACAIDRAQM